MRATLILVSLAAALLTFGQTAKKSSSTAKKTSAKKTTSTTSGSSKKKAATKQTATKQTATATKRRSSQQQPTPERYKEIQQALADKGYFGGAVDGNWGPNSVDALKRFQHDQNLNEDGKLGALSVIALGLGPKHSQPQ